ncbi:MAG: hypothetical protein HPY61_09365 [Methanotrichaceae archaeon]|nr:hypothetical protein [Methanotrichaceae archaeon]
MIGDTTPAEPGLSPLKGRLSTINGQRYERHSCPLCWGVIRYLRIKGNLSSRGECSNPACTWTLEPA